jgi:hypothetical protein
MSGLGDGDHGSELDVYRSEQLRGAADNDPQPSSRVGLSS